MPRYPLRLWVALLLLAGLALLSDARALWVRLEAWGHVPNEVGASERRFAELRRMLPPFGTVEYLSDRLDASREYFLTQYALAPRIVVPGGDHDLAVGNFFDEDAGARIVASGRLIVVHNFGEGLLLLRRKTP